MPDANSPIALLLGAIAGITPTVAVLFKMLIAEKDARIKYLEQENLDLRDIARGSTDNTQQAISVAHQRGS